jgi:hypothetical protein
VSAQHHTDPQPNSTREANPHCFLPWVAKKWASVPRSACTSASLLRRRKPLCTQPDTSLVTIPNTSPLSAPHACYPLVKFWSHPVPRCSVQASVTCPSHPLAYRLTCGPPASRIASEALHRPVVLPDCCHRRCTTMMPVPSTQRQCLAQRLCFLLPCWHRVRLRLASSCLAPRRVGTVHWHTHEHHVSTNSP